MTELEAVAQRVIRRLTEKGAHLATAESCTGGAIAATLVGVEGASKAFVGGVVSYTNEVKMRLLDVKRETLEHFSAVSEETGREMACNVLIKTGADYALSVTGYAGKSGVDNDADGMIYITLTSRSGFCQTKMKKYSQERNGARLAAVYDALTWLEEYLYAEE